MQQGPSSSSSYTPQFGGQPDKRKEIQMRKQKRDRLLGFPRIEQLGGLLAEFHQRNAYSDEAMAGRIIAMYLEFIFGFVAQPLDGWAKKNLLTAHQLIYLPEGGVWPEIYPLGADGEPDLTKDPYPPCYPLGAGGRPDQTQPSCQPAEVDEWVIWKNGYFPNPTIGKAFSMCLAEFTAKVLGRQALDPLSSQRLFGEPIHEKHSPQIPEQSQVRRVKV